MALFVPLDASYPQDPKILDLDDERSELLFIRSLAYCKAHQIGSTAAYALGLRLPRGTTYEDLQGDT